MKKIMFILTTILILLVIMSSALKPKEDNTKIQTGINEPMNVAVVSGGNDNQLNQESGYETIYTEEFEDTIVELIMGTAEINKEKAIEKGWKEDYVNNLYEKGNNVEIQYPKVIISKKNIKFQDVNGAIQKEIELETKARCWNKEKNEEKVTKIKTVISENEQYIGLLVPYEVNMLEWTYIGSFEVYNTNGEKMWSLDSVSLSDGDIRISPNGEYAVGMPPGETNEGYPFYYDKKGMRELEEKKGKYIVPGGIYYSPDGEYFIIKMGKSLVDNIIMKYDKDGKKIWEKKDKGWIFSIIPMNTTEEIIINKEKEIYLLSTNGELIRKYIKENEELEFSFIKISDNDKYLYIIFPEKEKIKAFEINNFKLEWVYENKVLENKLYINDFFQNNSIIVLDCNISNKGIFIVLNKMGKEISRKNYKEKYNKSQILSFIEVSKTKDIITIIEENKNLSIMKPNK